MATGPSLTAEQATLAHDARRADRCRVIAVNEAGLRRYLPLAAPWADVLYAADRHWWSHYLPAFAALRVSGEPVPAIEHNGVKIPAVETTPLKMLERDEKMPREPGSVVSGGHSGFQALGLALTLGASRIILLGMDCGGGPTRNCHTNRPEQFNRDVNMNAWAECYRRVPVEFPQVEVLNCGQYSRIDCFERAELEEVL
jgi:hypothetical protein